MGRRKKPEEPIDDRVLWQLMADFAQVVLDEDLDGFDPADCRRVLADAAARGIVPDMTGEALARAGVEIRVPIKVQWRD